MWKNKFMNISRSLNLTVQTTKRFGRNPPLQTVDIFPVVPLKNNVCDLHLSLKIIGYVKRKRNNFTKIVSELEVSDVIFQRDDWKYVCCLQATPALCFWAGNIISFKWGIEELTSGPSRLVFLCLQSAALLCVWDFFSLYNMLVLLYSNKVCSLFWAFS